MQINKGLHYKLKSLIDCLIYGNSTKLHIESWWNLSYIAKILVFRMRF
ncbi:hypothetical protein [uncultured Helicobacter sp.]|nr:hypothetical protein [uncultured Helicobacter sp.]